MATLSYIAVFALGLGAVAALVDWALRSYWAAATVVVLMAVAIVAIRFLLNGEVTLFGQDISGGWDRFAVGLTGCGYVGVLAIRRGIGQLRAWRAR